ncbi:MAG: hypothetical protein JWP81_3153 [Ferruginibacter sp.]|nr:hypothetical protein [Ferruginibacter sp.]
MAFTGGKLIFAAGFALFFTGTEVDFLTTFFFTWACVTEILKNNNKEITRRNRRGICMRLIVIFKKLVKVKQNMVF